MCSNWGFDLWFEAEDLEESSCSDALSCFGSWNIKKAHLFKAHLSEARSGLNWWVRFCLPVKKKAYICDVICRWRDMIDLGCFPWSIHEKSTHLTTSTGLVVNQVSDFIKKSLHVTGSSGLWFQSLNDLRRITSHVGDKISCTGICVVATISISNHLSILTNRKAQ